MDFSHYDSADGQYGSSRRSFRRRRSGQGGRRRGSFALFTVLVVIAAGVVYDLFFHVHDVRPRTVVVNGENVGDIDGISLHSATWLSQAEVDRFFTHIQVPDAKVPKGTTVYRGEPYVRVSDVVAALNAFGDESKFAGGQLQVNLKPNQHYAFSQNGDSIRQQEVWWNGKLLGRVLLVNHAEADYVPAASVASLLSHAGADAAWTGQAFNLSLTGKASPSAVEDPQDDRVIAFGKGNAIYAPAYTWDGATYLPVYSLDVAFRQLGWTSTVGQWKWSLTSGDGKGTSGTSTSGTGAGGKPVVLGFVPFYSGDLAAYNDVMQHQNVYNALAADTWTVDASGSLNGSAPAGSVSQAAAAGDAVYAMVTNLGSSGFNAQEMTTILSSPTRAAHLEGEITRLVPSEGYDGVVLDFESIPAANRAAYTNFVTGLAKSLHAEGKRLEVVVPPDTGSANEPWNNAYDQAKIGAAADAVVVMAYDYSYVGGKPGPIAPLPWVQQVLAYTISRVPVNKVLLGVDTYGYDWTGNQTSAVSLTSVDSFLASRHIQPQWDANAQAPWYTWTDSNGAVHTVYYENARSTQAKLALANLYGIEGVAVWRAGLEDNAVLGVLATYAKGTVK